MWRVMNRQAPVDARPRRALFSKQFIGLIQYVYLKRILRQVQFIPSELLRVNQSARPSARTTYHLIILPVIIYRQMQESVFEKQQYLRLEILQSGYDPEDFIQFMSTHSSIQTPTIENLTLEQLTQIVQEYKQVVASRQGDEPKFETEHKSGTEPREKRIFTEEKVKVLEERRTRIEYDRFGTCDYELKGIVNCVDAESAIKQDRIEVSVPEMESTETEGFIFGLGARTQYYYLIKTNLIKGTVKRMSEDFDWLNSTLLRLYPHLVLPELEPVRKDIKDPYVKRQKQIEEYLQHLCDKKYLMSSNVFVDFLTLSSDKMQRYKKSYDSMGFARGVSLLKTQEGVVEIDLSNRTRQLYSTSKQFARKTSLLHDNISQAMTKMIESYRIAIADTYTVVDMFAELHDVFSEISNKFPSLKKEDYNDTLVNLNNLFLGVGDNFKNITETLEKYTKDYYRFYNGLDRNLQKLQRFVKDSETQYIQFKINLQRKKQRVISDPSKWDIDQTQIDPKKLSKEELMKAILPKQVNVQSELKSWYAFNLKNYENQLSSYLRFITKRYQKVYKSLAVDLLTNDKMYLEAITKFISDARKVEKQQTKPQ